MNGEIYLSCALCVALKSALRGNPKPLLQDQKYIKYLNFEFAKEHFRTTEGASRAAHYGVNDASKAAEQKDAYGSVQSSATDEARESGETVKQKRANRKEAANEKAANEKAANKKGADESTGSSFLQKAHKFFYRTSRAKRARGRADLRTTALDRAVLKARSEGRGA